jgi:hypothetical protein
MKSKFKLKLILIALIVLVILPATAIPTKRIDVYIFHRETCGSCSIMVGYIEDLYKQYPTMVIHVLDLSEKENEQLYDVFCDVYGLNMKGHPVPLIFIGKDSFRGYSPATQELIERKISGCFGHQCTIDIGAERDVIVIIDHTPTPNISTIFLFPFLILAGFLCCAAPYTIRILQKVATSKTLFFGGFFITSVFLCFALATIIYWLPTVVSWNLLLVVIVSVMGILTMVSSRFTLVKVPSVIDNDVHALLKDNSAFSVFCAGVEGCLASLVYTLGVYMLVAYSVLFFSLMDRLQNYALFNVCVIGGVVGMYILKVKPGRIWYIVMGTGSIGLGIVFWAMMVML